MVKFIELLGSMSYIYTVIQNNFILLCCTGSYFLWLWLGTSHRRNNLFQETYSLVLRNELDNFFLFERKNFIWVIGFFFFFNFFLLPLIFLLFTRLSSDIQKKKKMIPNYLSMFYLTIQNIFFVSFLEVLNRYIW